jgi:phasin family protein
MFTNPEQFASVTKTLFEFQLDTFNTLTSKTIQGVEQVLELNLGTAKNAVVDSIAKARRTSQAKDAKELADSAKAQLGKGDEAAEYQRQLAAIVSAIHKDFADAAEAHMAEARTNLSALIYDVTKNVRPGSENAVAIVKTAIDNAFSGYEQVTRATRQAVAAVEAEVAKAAEQIAPLADLKADLKAAAETAETDEEAEEAEAGTAQAKPAPKARTAKK